MKLVTGASGLLGSEIVKIDSNAVSISSKDCDLRKDNLADFLMPNIDTVIHCAAKVGGLKANSDNLAEFFDNNIQMNMKVFEACQKKKVKLLSVMSTCVYPDAKYVKYPLTEDQLHIGPPHDSNFGYAYAKRMLDVQGRAYRRQYGSNFVTVIPNNLYGLNDNYHLQSGHVIPSLVRKFCEAKMRGEKSVQIWGSGKPLREFTFARDAAKIILWIAENYDCEEPVNIGNPEQVSIEQLAVTIAKIVKFEGHLEFDSTKPDGQFEKPSSNEKLLKLGWKGNYTSLYEGLTETIDHFQSIYPQIRGF